MADIDEKAAPQEKRRKQIYRQMVLLGEEAVKTERRTIIRLRDEGLISDDVLRTIEREMDLEESRYLEIEISL